MDFSRKAGPSAPSVAARLRDLAREVQSPDLVDLAAEIQEKGLEGRQDGLSTRLMEVYRDTGSPQAFGLLYELNSRPFFITILGRLRRNNYRLDANDVLQEVFINIYRYPFKFKADKPQAFRNWAGMIIRNTILRFLKAASRESRFEFSIEDLLEPADENALSPQDRLIRGESAEACHQAWLLYLQLYLEEYNKLNDREREALYLVEVEGFTYKEVSAEMGIKVENLKMVIFRARKKIMRNMQRRLEGAARASAEVVGS